MAMSVPELAQHYGRAWAYLDLDAIIALHTPDSVFHVHGLADAAIGRESVRAAVAQMIRLVPDLRFQTIRAYIGADHMVSEYVMSGTVGGSPFAFDGVDVIQIAGGYVSRKDTYLDIRAHELQAPFLVAGG
jgi:ketosteroid isomerase-like protein